MIKSSFGRRRRLTCFFCGHKITINTTEPYIKSFTCDSPYCGLVNHLDKQGNIIDYIPPQSAAVPRYGRSIRSPSPPPNAEDGDARVGRASPIFCRTCQKHQTIKTNLLRDYLPPDNDPQYAVYWEKLPEFKKQLEEKYPEPCEPCAARAQKKIKEANYLARTALVRSLLEQSQNMKPRYHREPWGLSRATKLAFWIIRALGWNGTHILVAAWHAFTLLYPIPLHDMADLNGTWGMCLNKSWNEGKVDLNCYEVVSVLAKRVIPWSFAFLFWNYRALENTRHPRATLIGYSEYLRCEIMMLITRMVAWFMLTPGKIRVDFSPDALKAWSLGFLLLEVVGFLYAITALKLIHPTPINMRESASPMESPPPSHRNTTNHYSSLSNTRHHAPIPPRQPHFAPVANNDSESIFPPLSSFDNPQPSTLNNAPHAPGKTSLLLPPPRPTQRQKYVDNTDKMDWNPTSPQEKALWNLSSSSRLNSTTTNDSNNISQNPFAAPVPQAPRSSMFQSLVRAQATQHQQPGLQDALPAPRESFFKPTNNSGGFGMGAGEARYPPMAEPRFFPKSIIDGADTGLEGLLSGRLKLEDEPDIVKIVDKVEEVGDAWWVIVVRVLLLGLAYWGFMIFAPSIVLPDGAQVETIIEMEEPPTGPMNNPLSEDGYLKHVEWIKLASLGVALICAVWKLISNQNRSFSNSTSSTAGLEKLLLATESMAGVLLLIFTSGSINSSRADLLGRLYLGWLFSRELWDFVVAIQQHQQSPTIAIQEEEPGRRREVSPGLGEWPLPAEKRSFAKVPGATSSNERALATLRRDGSSNLSTLGAGGLRDASTGRLSGMGVPSIQRSGSGGLSGMVRDAGMVDGVAGRGGVSGAFGVGSGAAGLRREASGGFGGGGVRREGSFRRENSGAGGGGFGALSLN